MGKIFYIMGKSASGKDTIYGRLAKDQRLRSRLGFSLKTIVLYTTRPIRQGETEGVEYHFVTDEKRLQMEKNGQIIEQRTYETIYGPWTYFTASDDQIQLERHSYIMIGTLEGYESVKGYYGKEQVVPLYIELDDGKRLLRAILREEKQTHPGYEEVCRRFLADQKDFSKEKLKAAGIEEKFVNEDLEQCLNEIVEAIKKALPDR